MRLGLRALKQYRIDEPANDLIINFNEISRLLALCVRYWQSHPYFDGISKQIRSELQPRGGPTPQVAELKREIGDRETIAIHVRRGDYVTEPHAAGFHGALGSRHYESATFRIAKHVDRPLAVVLSDDPEWASLNLRLEVETIHAKQQQRMTAPEILSTMAVCKHHVIANSSLSWWGAYLATHHGQKVLYPDRWFRDKEIDPEVKFPVHWQPHAGA